MKKIKPVKPLGKPAYGSIPHLRGSRLGPGEHHISIGQEKMATDPDYRVRKHSPLFVHVSEKLDGSNVAVAKTNGRCIALGRAGYPACTSPYKQHYYFHMWVLAQKDRFESLLNEGERVCGEWLLQVHGTKYDLWHEPFVPFDIMQGNNRLTVEERDKRLLFHDFTLPKVIHQGMARPLPEILAALDPSGHGASVTEGAVWRVERHGKVEFLCKYVRPEKVDGIFLDEQDPVWNYDLDKMQEFFETIGFDSQDSESRCDSGTVTDKE